MIVRTANYERVTTDCQILNIYRPFTRKEDNPSARIILEGSVGLHAKTRLLESTLHFPYMQDLCSARLQSKMAGESDKSVALGVLLFLLALITAFQHQCAIIYSLIFQIQQQRAMNNNIGPPRCVSVSSSSSLGRDTRNCRLFEL